MKSKNPYSGCRQVEIAKTLDTTDPNPSKNQGGIVIMHPYILCESRSQDGVLRVHEDTCPAPNTAQDGQRQPCVVSQAKQYPFCKSSRPSFKGDSETYIDCKVSNTLNTFDLGDKRANELVVETVPVCCVQENCIERLAEAYLANGKDTVGTLLANAGTKQWLGNQEAFSGDYHIIEKNKIRYIVRRLIPTECARLQGFADDWGIPDYKEDFTEEEYLFWLEVRNTYAFINGKKTKEYSKEQMLTWYNKLHSDSSEYKMWGNGIALPPTLYCMQGISDAISLLDNNPAICC